MNNNPNLRAQAKAVFIGNFFSTVLQFLIPAMLVRLITKEDFGYYRQFQLFTGTFISLLNFGLNTSFFYFFPRLDFSGKQRIMQQTQLFFLLILICFSIAMLSFGDLILEKLNFSEFQSMKGYILIYVFAMILSSGIIFIITLEKNLFLNKIYPPAEKLVYVLIFLISIILIPGYEGPIIALLIFSLVKLGYFYYHNFQYFKKKHKIDKNLVKQQLFYSLPFGLALMLGVISESYDKFFINLYITPEEYAVYSLSFLGIPLMAQFYQSIHNVVVQEISYLLRDNRLQDATKLWQRTVDKTSSVTIPVVILFLILADEVITILYTVKYIDAANFYRIFILMFLITMFSHEIILRGINKTKYILISNIIGVLIVVITGFFIIPLYGLNGAIITALLGVVSPIIISLFIEKRIMGLKWSNWVNWKNLGINAIICILIALPLYLFKDNISNIYFRVFIVGAVYAFWVIFFQMKFEIFIFNAKFSQIKSFFK